MTDAIQKPAAMQFTNAVYCLPMQLVIGTCAC